MFWRNSERNKRSSEDPDDLKHDVKPSVFRKSSSGDITAVILIKTSPDLTLKQQLKLDAGTIDKNTKRSIRRHGVY